MPNPSSSATDELPLISERFLMRLAAIIVLLVVATVAIGLAGRWLGERMALGGHTESEERLAITIGQDRLVLPANVIRFDEQRHSGAAERVDLYLTWPDMNGYSQARRNRFDNIDQPGSLVFMQMSQSTMSKDMSGRLKPIYAQLFDGAPQPYAYGLTLNRLRPDSGYGDEVILTGSRKAGSPYVVRCVLPAPGETPTGADCQRDIHAGGDLTVLYRFSSTLLKDWDHIDAAVESFVRSRLDGTASVARAQDD